MQILDGSALPPVHGNGAINDRTAVDAFPCIKNEEEIREALQHHQALTFGTFHQILLGDKNWLTGDKEKQILDHETTFNNFNYLQF
jgi:hypothetical protein